MSIALTKVDSFVEKLAEKQIDLSGTGLTVALTNTAHTASWTQLSDLTQIAYTGLSSRTCTVASSGQTSGTYILKITDLVLTASGTIPTFRYIYLYDDAGTNDPLIGYYDYGSGVDLATGNLFTIDFDTAGVITIK